MSSRKHLTIQKVRRSDTRVYTEICNTPYSDYNIGGALKDIMRHCDCRGWYRKIRKDLYDIILSGDQVEKAQNWFTFAKLHCTVLPETVVFSETRKESKIKQFCNDKLSDELALEFDDQDDIDVEE